MIPKRAFNIAGLTAKQFSKKVYAVLSEVYLSALEDATPKGTTGLTRASWMLIEEETFKYKFVNLQGPIIIYLEEGTKPHIITPKNKKALRFEVDKVKRLSMKLPLKNAKVVYTKEVHHPGTEAMHFIRNIFSSEQLMKEFETKLFNELKKLG